MFAALVDERQQGLADAGEFGGVFVIGIFKALERAGGVHKVARVDAHALTDLGSRHGSLRLEVNVGDKGDVAPLRTQDLGDFTDAQCLLDALSREPHIVGPGIGDALALCRTGLNVVGGGIGHRLDTYGPLTAHLDATHIDVDGGAAFIIENHIFRL